MALNSAFFAAVRLSLFGGFVNQKEFAVSHT